jgi:hypothetical protein
MAMSHRIEEHFNDVRGVYLYIAPSGNSLASYLQPANVMAMSQAIRKYGRYPIAG